MIQEPKEKTEASRKRSVTLYLSVLFAVAFLLLLLAFFMQQRSSENIIGTLQSSANNAELLNEIIDENRNLQTENAELIRQVEELQAAQEEASARLSQYQTQIAELEAALAQQASDLTYEERIHLESFTVLLAQYGRLEKLLRETEYAKAATLYTGMVESTPDFNQFVSELALVDLEGSPLFDLELRMQEIGAQLADLGYLPAP